jgi:nucleotide-binding universal stress UspA family protein
MTILVATDGSDPAKAAARVAYELARADGDRILFVTVWRELRPDFGMPIDLAFPELVETERDHAATVLSQAKDEAEAAGLEAETLSRCGYPVHEICAVARESGARVIVIGSRGWETTDGAMLGSVATGLLHDAPCPVQLVPGAEIRRQETQMRLALLAAARGSHALRRFGQEPVGQGAAP